MLKDEKTGTFLALTDSIYPELTKQIFDEEKNEQTGIQYTYKSQTSCPYEKDAKFTFTNKVMCNSDIATKGDAKILNAKYSNTCNPEVTISHASGCSIYSVSSISVWMEEKWWFTGSLLIVFGLAIGMAGRKLEKFMVAFIGALVVFGLVLWIGDVAGLFETMGEEGL